MKKVKGIEQRANARYPVERGTFAVFSGAIQVLPGIIVDISKTGLAFLYLDSENWPAEMTGEYHLFGDDFHVGGVYLEMITDIEAVGKEHPLYELACKNTCSPLKVRRRGVCFKDLSQKQHADLDIFIERFQKIER